MSWWEAGEHILLMLERCRAVSLLWEKIGCNKGVLGAKLKQLIKFCGFVNKKHLHSSGKSVGQCPPGWMPCVNALSQAPSLLLYARYVHGARGRWMLLSKLACKGKRETQELK